MEESSLSPQTPYFGNPCVNINFSDTLKSILNHEPNSTGNKKASKKEKGKKSKNKRKKHNNEKNILSKPTLDKENPYYELLTKKIKLRNDFDEKHAKKFLSEKEEPFDGCDLDDEISEDEY